MTNPRLMQVKSIADSAILSTFIKLPLVIKIFVLSIFEWPFYTGFTVLQKYYVRSAISSSTNPCHDKYSYLLRSSSIFILFNMQQSRCKHFYYQSGQPKGF